MSSAQPATTPIGIDLGTTPLDAQSAALAATFVRWLQSGVRPEGLFSATVFGDLSLPQWRLQTRGPGELFAVREVGHRGGHTVRVEQLLRTGRGFLIQFDERWRSEGQDWYARELAHVVVEAGRITEFVLYCTGDWDEATQRRHAEEVTLVRP